MLSPGISEAQPTQSEPSLIVKLSAPLGSSPASLKR